MNFNSVCPMTLLKKWSLNLGFTLFYFITTAALLSTVHADTIDGEWELRITGTDNLEFGTQFLAGGLTINWTSTLLFTIKDGYFFLGTGLAKLDKNISTFSRPENTFECNNIPGTYVSKSGLLFETPHLRYVSFPVSGQTQLKKKGEPTMMKLMHGMEYPGNYYGVLFECKTQNSLGKTWLEQSPRVSQEKASRQSISTSKVDNVYIAKVKQVKSIAPGAELVIPLIDLWQMSFSDSFGESNTHYQLLKK